MIETAFEPEKKQKQKQKVVPSYYTKQLFCVVV